MARNGLATQYNVSICCSLAGKIPAGGDSMAKVVTLTVREAAVQFRYTIPYLYSLLHAERIPGAHRVDGEWRLPAVALKEHQAKAGRHRQKAAA